MNDEQRRRRVELLEEIRMDGGEKTFAIGQVPSEVFQYLAGLQTDELIEEVPSGDPLAFTYKLKQ